MNDIVITLESIKKCFEDRLSGFSKKLFRDPLSYCFIQNGYKDAGIEVRDGKPHSLIAMKDMFTFRFPLQTKEIQLIEAYNEEKESPINRNFPFFFERPGYEKMLKYVC